MAITTTYDAWEDVIAEAIAEELNHEDRTWNAFFDSEETVAIRTRDARIRHMEDLAALVVFVIPQEIDQDKDIDERFKDRRPKREIEYEITIALGRLVEPDDDDMLKALSRVAQDIHFWFDRSHVLANFENDAEPIPELISMADWRTRRADRKNVCLYGRLYEDRIWQTEIDVRVFGIIT